MTFKPFENDEDVVGIGGMTIENDFDAITMSGDLIIKKDEDSQIMLEKILVLITNIKNNISNTSHESNFEEKTSVVLTVKNPFES